MWNSVTSHQSCHTHTNETTMTPKQHIITKGACCRLAGWPDGYTEGPITERWQSDPSRSSNWTHRVCFDGEESAIYGWRHTTPLKKLDAGLKGHILLLTTHPMKRLKAMLLSAIFSMFCCNFSLYIIIYSLPLITVSFKTAIHLLGMTKRYSKHSNHSQYCGLGVDL